MTPTVRLLPLAADDLLYRGSGRSLSAARAVAQEFVTLDFDAFFKQSYGPIVRSLTAAFGSDAGVEESVQDAFIRAHTRWRKIRRYDSPASWVRRVAINRLHDQRRSSQRRQDAEARAWALQLGQPKPEFDRTGELVERIQTLPPRQRLAMALFYVEDISVRDVAASMGISEGAVKAHLSQGRDSLAQGVTTPRRSETSA